MLRGAGGMCRVIRREDGYFDQVFADNGCGLVAFWHESLALAAHFYRDTGVHTLTSYSFDGELAARFVRGMGMCAIRGSSSRGGYRALKNLAQAVEEIRKVGFTVDGPKGPRRVSKPGLAILSIRTGAPILPHALIATRAIRLNSWDRLTVPVPFGTLVSVYGEPISPPEKFSSANVERLRGELDVRLNELHRQVEDEFSVDAGLD